MDKDLSIKIRQLPYEIRFFLAFIIVSAFTIPILFHGGILDFLIYPESWRYIYFIVALSGIISTAFITYRMTGEIYLMGKDQRGSFSLIRALNKGRGMFLMSLISILLIFIVYFYWMALPLIKDLPSDLQTRSGQCTLYERRMRYFGHAREIEFDETATDPFVARISKSDMITVKEERIDFYIYECTREVTILYSPNYSKVIQLR